MLKTLFVLSLLAVLATAQTPGTVDVSASITAASGTLKCVGTATVGAASSLMAMKCSDGADVLLDTTFKVASVGSAVYSVQRGTNTITWILTKGNAIPDQWQVSANGTTKSGNF